MVLILSIVRCAMAANELRDLPALWARKRFSLLILRQRLPDAVDRAVGGRCPAFEEAVDGAPVRILRDLP